VPSVRHKISPGRLPADGTAVPIYVVLIVMVNCV